MKYLVSMFPFTSGRLHLGHFRAFLIQDILYHHSRFKLPRLGFDSFGLPTENAAKVADIPATVYTNQCIESMKNQFKEFKFKVEDDMPYTSDPTYFKWTQFLFIQLYNHGLVYRSLDYCHWDPADETVLANEQVINGRGERSNAIVETIMLPQWFIKIKEFEEKLYDQLGILDWPEKVLDMQKNWIGRMDGVLVDFDLYSTNTTLLDSTNTTLLDSTVGDIMRNGQESRTLRLQKIGTAPVFIKNPNQRMESTYALVHPLNPSFRSSSPSNHKLKFGNAFFTFTNTFIKQHGLTVPVYFNTNVHRDYVYYGDDKKLLKYLQTHSFGVDFDQSILHDDKSLKDSVFGEVGENKRLYKLRDWVISRQRTWGTPIPLIECDIHSFQPVDLKHLPVTHETRTLPCPICQKQSKTSHETLDTFFDSSFYYYRFLDPFNSHSLIDVHKSQPVDIYIGGIEHAVLHLLYARFVSMFMDSIGLVSVENGEPFKRLLPQGMVLGTSFKDSDGRYYHPEQVLKDSDGCYVIKEGTRIVLKQSIEKMSKSKYNGIEPSQIIQKHGLNATRLYIAYKASPYDALVWDENGINGMTRFLAKLDILQKRVLGQVVDKVDTVPDVSSSYNTYAENMEKFMFHWNITLLFKLLKQLEKHFDLQEYLWFLRMLWPFVPNLAEEYLKQLATFGFRDMDGVVIKSTANESIL